jgi:hypothetical protein
LAVALKGAEAALPLTVFQALTAVLEERGVADVLGKVTVSDIPPAFLAAP